MAETGLVVVRHIVAAAHRRADRYIEQAAELRKLAETVPDRKVRELLINLACDYAELAATIRSTYGNWITKPADVAA
jgi:hypothetical protein